MTNDLLMAVATIIQKQYTGVNVSLVKIEQGFHPPAFFVRELRQDYKQVATQGHKRAIHNIHIRYHPKDENDNLESQEVGNTLKFLLEIIDFKDCKIRGSSMYYQIIDCVLHFFINFELDFYIEKEEKGKMETLETEVKEWQEEVL